MKFYIVSDWMMENTMMAFIFGIPYVTPIIKLSIRVISELILGEMSHTNQLKDGKYNGDNYFSNFLCHIYN